MINELIIVVIILILSLTNQNKFLTRIKNSFQKYNHIYKFHFKNLNKLFVKNCSLKIFFNFHESCIYQRCLFFPVYDRWNRIFIQRIRKKRKRKKRCFRCTDHKYSSKFFFFFFFKRFKLQRVSRELHLSAMAPSLFFFFFSFFVTVEEIKAILHRWSIVICRVWTFRRVW